MVVKGVLISCDIDDKTLIIKLLFCFYRMISSYKEVLLNISIYAFYSEKKIDFILI